MNTRINTLYDPEYHAIEELNETCEPFKIGNLSYLAGDTLREVDPIAFKEVAADIADRLIQDGCVGFDESGDYIWLKD